MIFKGPIFGQRGVFQLRRTDTDQSIIAQVVEYANEGRSSERKTLVEEALLVAHSDTPEVPQMRQEDDVAVRTRPSRLPEELGKQILKGRHHKVN